MHVASSGRQALKLFHSHEEEIDAVILDYEMPKMNGVEATALIRERLAAAGPRFERRGDVFHPEWLDSKKRTETKAIVARHRSEEEHVHGRASEAII